MPGIARATIDYSSTHSNGDTHTAPAETKYVASQTKVLINGKPAIIQGGSTACGDTVVGCSTKVFITDKGVHRLGDQMSSHAGTYSSSVCTSASDNVIAA
jgi:uncharacterized Zn-binding protein involved in type VI secretion